MFAISSSDYYYRYHVLIHLLEIIILKMKGLKMKGQKLL